MTKKNKKKTIKTTSPQSKEMPQKPNNLSQSSTKAEQVTKDKLSPETSQKIRNLISQNQKLKLENEKLSQNNAKLFFDNIKEISDLITFTGNSIMETKKTNGKTRIKFSIMALIAVIIIVGVATFLTFTGHIDGSTFTFLLGLIAGYLLTFLQSSSPE